MINLLSLFLKNWNLNLIKLRQYTNKKDVLTLTLYYLLHCTQSKINYMTIIRNVKGFFNRYTLVIMGFFLFIFAYLFIMRVYTIDCGFVTDCVRYKIQSDLKQLPLNIKFSLKSLLKQ